MSSRKRREGRGVANGQEPTGDARPLRQLTNPSRSEAPDERELAALVAAAATGDRGSQDRLFAAHMPMVARLATARGDEGLPVADLVQEGAIGLMEAVRRFGTSGEADFERFAQGRIGAQIDTAIAAEAASVREAELLLAAATDYERTELLLRRELHRAPSALEVAEKLEWSEERTRFVADTVATARRRHDEELLAFIDPESIDFDESDERSELDG